MNHRRFFPLLILGLALLLSGCITTRRSNFFTRHTLYRTVRVTDYQGHLVSLWLAEGPVWRHGKGYRFKAMERQMGGPIPVKTRYEYGRKVIVDGPNIVVTPCEKPEWLIERDGF